MAQADIHFPVLLTLEEAAQGTRRAFVFARQDGICPACQTGLGPDGQPCAVCRGLGRAHIPRQVVLAIPAGVNDQVRIRVSGQGRWDDKARQWGDLYLVCYLRPHGRYKRHGFDLTVSVPVPDPRPDELTVDTLAGPVRLKLPPDPKVTLLHLKGYGLPRRIGGGEAGDLTLCLEPVRDSAMPGDAARLVEAASHELRAGNWATVIGLLQGLAADDALDGVGHRLLGSAFSMSGDYTQAETHLHAAVEAQSSDAAALYAYGIHCAKACRYPVACVCLEACVQRSPNDAAARRCLRAAVRGLFGQAVPPLPPALQTMCAAAARAAEHRSYAEAVRRLDASARAAAEVQYLAGCAALMAMAGGAHTSAQAAAAAEDALPARLSSPELVLAYHEAFTLCTEHLSTLPVQLALSLRAFRTGRLERAVAALRRAAADARHGLVPSEAAASSDPIVADSVRAVYDLFGELAHGASSTRTAQPGSLSVNGLLALTRMHYAARNTGDLQTAWSDAVRAVEALEMALCQTPDDAAVAADFRDAADAFAGVAGALLGQMDPDQAEFVANTRDALATGLVPGAPLAELVGAGADAYSLNWACEDAYRRLSDGSRSPARGEFLVGACEGQYVLTNYRLLLLTDRLAVPQLLPLNVIDRYLVRAGGLTTSGLVIGVSGGRQLALDGMPNGTFPPEQVVAHLIAARMWETLTGDEAEVLATGVPAPAGQAAGALAPGQDATGAAKSLPAAGPTNAARPATCPQCGRAPKPGDQFCRKCGGPLTPPPHDPGVALITGGP